MSASRGYTAPQIQLRMAERERQQVTLTIIIRQAVVRLGNVLNEKRDFVFRADHLHRTTREFKLVNLTD